MFFYFSKIFEILTHPFSWIFILLIAALISHTKRKRYLIYSLFIAYFFSNAFIFDEVNRLWELDAVPLNQLKEKYEVAIVLGGMMTYDEENKLEGFDKSIDRLLLALPLHRAKKVERILISGGSGRLVEDVKEAQIAKEYLLKIGIPEKDIIAESTSRNTHENAINSVNLLKANFPKGPFLLITSASHMRRARACFKKEGLQFDIFPVDHISGPRKGYFNDLFLPQSHILDSWYWLIHEWLGFISYKIAGYC